MSLFLLLIILNIYEDIFFILLPVTRQWTNAATWCLQLLLLLWLAFCFLLFITIGSFLFLVFIFLFHNVIALTLFRLLFFVILDFFQLAQIVLSLLVSLIFPLLLWFLTHLFPLQSDLLWDIYLRNIWVFLSDYLLSRYLI